jgi:hypothetical protein
MADNVATSDLVLNPKTGYFIKRGSKLYKRLVKEGVIKEAPTPAPAPAVAEDQPAPEKKESSKTFNERDLQVKMAELTTDMVANNVKQIIKSQKLSDEQYDMLLKKMLYEKLCLNDDTKTAKTKTKTKTKTKEKKTKEKTRPKTKTKTRYRVVDSSSSETETTDSD